MTRYTVEVGAQVKAFYEKLGLTDRRVIKRALENLRTEQGNICGLEAPLEGYYRLKIGGFRILFRYASGRKIVCVYAAPRKLVYELFEQEAIRRLLGEPE